MSRLLYLTDEEHAAVVTAILRFPDEDWARGHVQALQAISNRYRAKVHLTDDRAELAREAAELVVANVPRATTDEIADGVIYALEVSA